MQLPVNTPMTSKASAVLLRIYPGDIPKERGVKLVREKLEAIGVNMIEQEIAQALPPGPSRFVGVEQR